MQDSFVCIVARLVPFNQIAVSISQQSNTIEITHRHAMLEDVRRQGNLLSYLIHI